MGNLRNETNSTPYIIANAFATLTLLTSVALAASSYFGFFSSVESLNIAFTVATVLSILSILVVVLSYENELGVWKNKFAKKVLELENELTLKQEAKETANNQMEELKNQLQQKDKELIDKKQQLDDKCEDISALTTEKEKPEVELTSPEENIRQLYALKNKELNDKDIQIQELSNQLGNLNTEKNDDIWYTQTSKAKIAKLKGDKNLLIEKLQSMREEIKWKDDYIARLDYNLNQIKSKEEHYMHSFLASLREKIKAYGQDLRLKEQMIEKAQEETKKLTEQIVWLNQKYSTLYCETKTYSVKNQKLIELIYQVVSGMGKEIEDIECLLNREKNGRRQINLKTMEDLLENLQKLHLDITNGAKGLNIPVEQGDAPSNSLDSPFCRNFVSEYSTNIR